MIAVIAVIARDRKTHTEIFNAEEKEEAEELEGRQEEDHRNRMAEAKPF